MTRAEAIKELQESHDTLRDYDIDNSSRLKQALLIAISALEQEPCEDAVSRDAVCNIVNDIRDCISVEGYWAILERLKKLPSVTVRQTGEWIEKEGYDGDVYYDCSVCGESWTTIEGTPWDNGMNFCPNCGADMRGAENDRI